MFCGLKSPEKRVKEITAQQLLEWQARGEAFQFVDVRELREYQATNIGAELIPLHTVTANAGRFSRDRKVVVHCHSGLRSAQAIRDL